MAFTFDILTLFPGYFDGVFRESLLGKAEDGGLVVLRTTQIRDFATDRHRTTDDTPFGGGAGMVMKIEPISTCLRAVREAAPGAPVVLLSPAGHLLEQARVRRWAAGPGLIVLCGRYEGFDARIEPQVDEIVSIGDYVLGGGEPAAAVIVDAVARLLPGVVGNPESVVEESHEDGLVEYPHYTKPRVFEDESVPDVLLSGNHAAIRAWRRAQAMARTRLRRPDLWALYVEVHPEVLEPPKTRRRSRRAPTGGANRHDNMNPHDITVNCGAADETD